MLVLSIRNVHKWPDLLPQVRILAVFPHTNDFNVGMHAIARAKREVAANRVLAMKVSLCHFLADARNLRCSGSVARIKLARGHEWNSQSREDMWSYPILLHVRIGVFRCRVSLCGDVGV